LQPSKPPAQKSTAILAYFSGHDAGGATAERRMANNE
jgi:hypothetical protein